jgi:hypothetical protein
LQRHGFATSKHRLGHWWPPRRDLRHRDYHVLASTSTYSRAFPGWVLQAMAAPTQFRGPIGPRRSRRCRKIWLLLQVLDCHWDCLLTLIEVHCFVWDPMSWFLMTQKSGKRFLEFELNIVARIGLSALDLIQIDTPLPPREITRTIAS